MSAAATATRLPQRAAERLRQRLEKIAGGRTRATIVVILACALALESADAAAVGAAGPQLESALHISNAQLGLLAAISTLVGALATVPAGAFTDRLHRGRMLAIAVTLWAAAMVAGATAQDYSWLLLSRLGLGAVTAAAGPAIASLTGDFFAASERAKVYGYILSGELLGAGIGFVVSGTVAGVLSWRWAFGVLALPALALAALIWFRLPEPERGGQAGLALEPQASDDQQALAQRAVMARRIDPVREHVLRRDPARMRLRDAVLYVLRIRTNRWLIAASAIGYFFFAGLRTFGVVFVRGQFGLDQASATIMLFLAGLGSLAGVLIAGRIADRLIARGMISGRMVVGATAYLMAPLFLMPALLLTSMAAALPLLIAAGAALAAPNPPLDAARLDIVPARLWGRAEGVRTLLRQAAQAGAPLLFGAIADALGGRGGTLGSRGTVSPASALALKYTFLIMLVPLAVNGIALLLAKRSYPPDVATALASEGEIDSER